MLSSVLHSRRAADVNVAIMRAFVRLREILSTHKDLARRIDELERKYDGKLAVVFDAIRELMSPAPPPAEERPQIGFTVRRPSQERRARGRWLSELDGKTSRTCSLRPPDRDMGDLEKILYVHLPAAISASCRQPSTCLTGVCVPLATSCFANIASSSFTRRRVAG